MSYNTYVFLFERRHTIPDFDRVNLLDALVSFVTNGNIDLTKEMMTLNIPLPNNCSLLHFAKSTAMASSLLESLQSEIDRKETADGFTPLSAAVFNNNIDLARLYLDRGADVNCFNNYGQGVLHMAVAHGNEEMLKLLLSRNADAELADFRGITPFGLSLNTSNKMYESLYEYGMRKVTGTPRGTAPVKA